MNFLIRKIKFISKEFKNSLKTSSYDHVLKNKIRIVFNKKMLKVFFKTSSEWSLKN